MIRNFHPTWGAIRLSGLLMFRGFKIINFPRMLVPWLILYGRILTLRWTISTQRKFCGREGTVLMVTGHGHPLTHALSQSEQYAPLMLFDCRGYEPVEFAFGSGWKVESMDDDDERITNVRGRL